MGTRLNVSAILSVVTAVLFVTCIGQIEAEAKPQAQRGQARITIKAVLGQMHLRVNGVRVGELNTGEEYVATVPVGRVVVSVHQFWKLGWKSFVFTAKANGPNIFYVRASDVTRTPQYCTRLLALDLHHKTRLMAKRNPFVPQDVARCKKESK